MAKWLKRTAAVLVVLAAALFAWGALASEPLPTGTPGPAAEALAHRIAGSCNLPAWRATGAIAWNFADRNQHLWDRERQLIRVRFGDHEVLRYVHTDKGGKAFTGGREVSGAERTDLLQQAFARWANDSFWLNPLEKLFDPGTTRALVKRPDGRDALLVTYHSGGVTPGDSYLWIAGQDGTPEAFKMWVSIIPVGGVEATWQGWRTLATGARVSTLHQIGPKTLELKDIRAAARVAELTGGADPFAVLFQ